MGEGGGGGLGGGREHSRDSMHRGEVLNSEGEEEEEDFPNDNPEEQDDEDNKDVDDDPEGELGGHGKMVAFQAAIRAVLARQLEKMGQEVG